jgi:hypothetical protein
MVSFLGRSRRRRSRVHRDFSAPQQRAPETVTRLSRAYNQPQKSKWHVIAYAVVGAGLIVGAIVFAVSNVFSVRNVIVSNVTSQSAEARIVQIVEQTLNERPLGFLPPRSLWLFRANEASDAIKREFYVDTVQFVRHWPNVLKVVLPSNVVTAQWQSGDASYLVDRRGVLVQQLEQSDREESLVRIVDSEAKSYTLGNQVLSERDVQFAEKLYGVWKTTLDDVPLAYLLVEPNSLPTFKAYTTAGWYALVSAESDVAVQAVAMRRLIDEKLKDQQSSLMYIDVRFGSRLYYKLKE